jgi:hypothetical protein
MCPTYLRNQRLRRKHRGLQIYLQLARAIAVHLISLRVWSDVRDYQVRPLTLVDACGAEHDDTAFLAHEACGG